MFHNNKTTDAFSCRKNLSKFDFVVDFITYTLLLLFVILSFRYQYFLLNYREWGDESETIVAVKMMAAGMKLYSEVFNHHGPLTFLPGVITEKLGDFGIVGHRVSIAILQTFAVLSIFYSPVLKFTSQKILASVASATVILIFMPDILGHMYKYQTIAGVFLVVILSQYTVPIIFCSENLGKLRVILGTILIVSLPFLAVTYSPIAALLFIASFRRKHLRYIVIGFAVGLITNLLFLSIYGSFFGFLAFHLYLNMQVLPFYTGLQLGGELIINVVSVVTSDLTHFLSFIAILVSILILAKKENNFPWRTFFLVAGLLSLLARGSGFHGMPYFYAILPLISLNLGSVDTSSRASKQVILFFVLLCVIKISLILPGDKQKMTSSPIPTETEFSSLVDDFTDPEDRIIAYSFQNFEYLVADRLPASGHFFYLPWQEEYNKLPKFGIKIDACKQIKEVMPKVMLIDKWNVWGRFSWNSYAGCIQELLDSDYSQVPDRPYYVRSDLVNRFDDLSEAGEREMIPSPPLSESRPIELEMNKYLKGEGENKKLVALGVLFGTYSRTNLGTARLILKTEAREEIQIDFLLRDLLDNRYEYFDVPESLYVGGEITWLTGGGISTWESHDEKHEVFTCLKYVFSDGSRGFTPGCPMF